MIVTLIGFVKKELLQSLRDPRMRIVLFLMPIVQLCLFGYAISTEIKNVRLAVQLDSKDYILRDIYENCVESGWFIPAKSTRVEPYDWIESNEADAALVPPPGGLTKALGRGDAKLQLLINASNVVKAQTIDGYVRNIVEQTVTKDLKLPNNILPIIIEQRVLFNPDLNTAIFMVPGTMCMLMIITTMALANMAIVREKEMGTFEMLISAPVTKSEVIYGKTIPYVIIGMSNFPLILAVAMILFGVPMRGNYFVLFAAAFVFVCSSVALGTLISTFCQNQQQATLAGLLFIFPMVMLSGLMFPVENMPIYIAWMAYLDPLYHFMGLLRNILLKGGGGEYVILHIGVLFLMSILLFFVSTERFKTTLR